MYLSLPFSTSSKQQSFLIVSRQSPAATMHWCSVLIALNWAAAAFAQGNLGGDQSACSSNPWVYKGCYTSANSGRHGNIDWQLNTNPSNEKGYPGFTSNDQMTVTLCQTGCRAHGFKFAALFYGIECYCAATWPVPGSPSDGSTDNGIGSIGTNADIASTNPNSDCSAHCSGDNGQVCGGGDAISLYFDPSIQNDTALTTQASVGSPGNFLYFGCYSNVNPGPTYISIKTPNTVSCLTYCGRLGYAFATRSGIDSNTGTTCGCGSEIQAGLQIPESTCSNYCDGTANAQ